MSSPNAHALAFGTHHGVRNPYHVTGGLPQIFSPRLREKYESGHRPTYYTTHLRPPSSSHSRGQFAEDPYQRRYFHSPDTTVQPHQLHYASSRNPYTSSIMEDPTKPTKNTKKRSPTQTSSTKKKRQKKTSSKNCDNSSSDDDDISFDASSSAKKPRRAKKSGDSHKKPSAKKAPRATKTNMSRGGKRLPSPPHQPTIKMTMTCPDILPLRNISPVMRCLLQCSGNIQVQPPLLAIHLC